MCTATRRAEICRRVFYCCLLWLLLCVDSDTLCRTSQSRPVSRSIDTAAAQPHLPSASVLFLTFALSFIGGGVGGRIAANRKWPYSSHKGDRLGGFVGAPRRAASGPGVLPCRSVLCCLCNHLCGLCPHRNIVSFGFGPFQDLMKKSVHIVSFHTCAGMLWSCCDERRDCRVACPLFLGQGKFFSSHLEGLTGRRKRAPYLLLEVVSSELRSPSVLQSGGRLDRQKEAHASPHHCF